PTCILQDCGDFSFCQDDYLPPRWPWWFHLLRWVLEKNADFHSVAQRLRQRSMNMQDRLSRQRLTGFPSFYVTLSPYLCLGSFNVNGRVFAHRDMPKEGNYLVPHNPSVPICSLGRNPSINVNAEPMLKVLSNGHLRRIDVRPFIATIEQAIKLCLRFT